MAVLLGLLVAVVGTAALWWQVLGTTGIAAWDVPVSSWVVRHRDPALVTAMQVVMLVGGAMGATLAATGTAVLLRLRTGSWRPGLALGAAVLLAKGVSALLKLLLERPRPPVEWVAGAPTTTWAFPSGHALTGGVLLMGAAALLAPTLSGWRRVLPWLAGAGVALGISAGRVVLGHHWLTDVLASWCLVCAVVPLLPVLARPRLAPPASTPTS